MKINSGVQFHAELPEVKNWSLYYMDIRKPKLHTMPGGFFQMIIVKI